MNDKTKKYMIYPVMISVLVALLALSVLAQEMRGGVTVSNITLPEQEAPPTLNITPSAGDASSSVLPPDAAEAAKLLNRVSMLETQVRCLIAAVAVLLILLIISFIYLKRRTD